MNETCLHAASPFTGTQTVYVQDGQLSVRPLTSEMLRHLGDREAA